MAKLVAGFVLSLMAFVDSAALAEVISWPQQLTGENGAVVLIYQPQVESFSGNSIEARAAVSVKSAATENAPVFGAIWIQAKIDVNRDTRTAVIRDVDVGDIRFADASAEQLQDLTGFIENQIEGASFDISVDQLLADLGSHNVEPAASAILISIDGEPVMEQIEGSDYERVVNSAFLIVQDKRNYFLYVGSNAWFEAQAVEGPWRRASNVPNDIAGLVEPADEGGEDVGDMDIIIATEPTELLVTDGVPSWAPVEGMDLLYLANTDSNAFLELSTQKYYVLLSGRWYNSEGMLGDLQWTHVPNDELPEPFGDIPEESVNGAILSQVAGTQQARDAVLDNTIPQTAAIDRSDASFSVEYDGSPDFAPIEEIKVEYAQNTASAVFRYGNLYYACDDGVWYVSNSATGPWSVATDVPDAIYKIPTSNAHHNVTYVKVYDVTPQVVYVGYTPGYYGSYYSHGAVVYGSGWYYHPWYGPHYYPRYPTWGFHVTYNPWTGWGVGVSWTNGPFRFTFSRHGSWWGVGGYRPYPRPYVHGGFRKTNINVNINNNINIGGGRDRPATRPSVYDRPDNRARNVERPAAPSNRQARPANNVQNNVLADRSGNVYQRGASGDWSQRDNGRWSQPQNMDRSTSRPSTSQASRGFDSQTRPATRPQLERDFNARQQGAQRSQNFQRQSSPRRR